MISKITRLVSIRVGTKLLRGRSREEQRVCESTTQVTKNTQESYIVSRAMSTNKLTEDTDNISNVRLADSQVDKCTYNLSVPSRI